MAQFDSCVMPSYMFYIPMLSFIFSLICYMELPACYTFLDFIIPWSSPQENYAHCKPHSWMPYPCPMRLLKNVCVSSQSVPICVCVRVHIRVCVRVRVCRFNLPGYRFPSRIGVWVLPVQPVLFLSRSGGVCVTINNPLLRVVLKFSKMVSGS